jgi:hypothetical protein
MHELPPDLYQIPLEQKLDLIEHFLIAATNAVSVTVFTEMPNMGL